MALYTRQQFAELLGMAWDSATRAKITMWSKRGKIVVVDDLIDDTNSQNKDWIKTQKEKIPEVSEIKSKKLETVVTPESKIEKVKNREPVSSGKNKYDLEVKKKELEIEKLKVDTRLQELKEEKIRGENVPIILMDNLIMVLVQSILTAQKDGYDQLLIEISKECRLTGEQLARLRGKLVKILNDGVDKSLMLTKKQLKSISDEYILKKEVGERE